MTTPIKIVIPGAPVPKGRGRIGKLHDGRPVVFTPKKTQNYENLVKMAASDGMQDQPPFTEPVDVVVHVALPVPASWSKKKTALALAGELMPGSRPDLDNFIKAALDGCNEIVFRDDSLVVTIMASKRYSDRPALTIAVELSDSDFH